MNTPSQLNIEALRQETPGCQKVLHFNNAGAGLMPQPVLKAMTDHLMLESTMGGYEAATEKQADLEGVYTSIAKLLNAQTQEIAIVENATRAWDMTFYAISFEPGDRILTSVSEYASNYIAFLQVSKLRGVEITVIPNDETGQTSVDALETMIDARVKLIAITHVPTNGGLVNPAVEIGKIARKYGILYLLDACQSVGQMPIDVKAIGCDVLSATGRKYLRGPRGIGLLYVNQSKIPLLEPPTLDLHSATWTTATSYHIREDARRFENWETSPAAKLGLGEAVDYALMLGLPTIWERIQSLANQLRASLSALPRVSVQDLGHQKCGIVSFTVQCVDAGAVQQHLKRQNINVSVSALEYTLTDMTARNLDSLVRASVHYYNTEAEIEALCSALSQLQG